MLACGAVAALFVSGAATPCRAGGGNDAAHKTLARHAKADPADSLGELPLVRSGTRAASGIWLNSGGVIACPLVAASGADVIVSFEGEQYPAKVINRYENYGFMLLRVQRQKAFTPLTLTPRLPPSAGHLKVVGLGPGGANGAIVKVTLDTTMAHLRRHVPELGLDGSYCELTMPPGAGVVADGAVLLDADTGDIYGMLIGGAGSVPGSRLAITSSSLSGRVATENLTLGADAPAQAQSIQFSDGHSVGAPMRQLQFEAAATAQKSLTYGLMISEWRHSTGFLTNAVTSPEIATDVAYFGDLHGNMYCIDLGTMQRQWVFDNTQPVYYPPTVGPNQICIAAGHIVFRTLEEEDTSLLGALGSLYGLSAGIHFSEEIRDYGLINCIDKQSGAFKWAFRTRYVTQPVIVGPRVLYSGFDILGALNLADGKRIWERNERHGTGKTYFYSIAGTDDQHMWVVCLPAKLTGKGTKREPYRLEKDSDAWIECYNQDRDEDPIWSHRYSVPNDAPPMCSAASLTPDKTKFVGATATNFWAFDAKTGEKLWDRETFPKANFAGSLTASNQMIYGTTLDNKLYAVSAVDGSVAWTFDGATAPLCIPAVQEGIVYVGSLDTWIYAIDAKSGRLVWKFETQGKVCGQPRVIGNKLYAMCDDGRLSEIELPQ